jgi:[acyl-carrier-protein] S-malonyltransferase
MNIAVLFPGQGSQFIGMAKDFLETDRTCAELMEKAEAVCGFPLKDITLNGPMEELTRAVHLQPAITVTNLICWQALRNALGDRLQVRCFAGHSLGEYSALCAAGAVSFEDTLRLVARRGALMEREGLKNPGGMRAVLGLDIAGIEELIVEYKGSGVVTAANHNTPQQVVISGSNEALEAVAAGAEAKGAKVIALNVSVANHSPLVADAVPDFADFIRQVEMKTPQIPVYFNVSAAVEEDVAVIREMMARQIAAKVRWYEIISGMLAEGIDTFIEVGPKTVLKGMMRKIVPAGVKVTTLQFDNPETLADCLTKLG